MDNPAPPPLPGPLAPQYLALYVSLHHVPVCGLSRRD